MIMTLFNWIGTGVTVVLFTVFLTIKLITRKKVSDIEGFCGIVRNGELETLSDSVDFPEL